MSVRALRTSRKLKIAQKEKKVPRCYCKIPSHPKMTGSSWNLDHNIRAFFYLSMIKTKSQSIGDHLVKEFKKMDNFWARSKQHALEKIQLTMGHSVEVLSYNSYLIDQVVCGSALYTSCIFLICCITLGYSTKRSTKRYLISSLVQNIYSSTKVLKENYFLAPWPIFEISLKCILIN